MTEETPIKPFSVTVDCPACGYTLATFEWPPGNPAFVESDCYDCGQDVRVFRDGSVEKR